MMHGSEAHSTAYVWRSPLPPMCGPQKWSTGCQDCVTSTFTHEAVLPNRLISFIHITLTKSSLCKRYSAQHQKCQGQDVQESEKKVAMVEPLSGLPRSRWNRLTDSNHGTRVGGGLGKPEQGMLLRTLGGHQRGR